MNAVVPPSSPTTSGHVLAATSARYQRILCAVDFSEISRAAFDKAVDLARSHHAALTVLHVFEPSTSGASDPVDTRPVCDPLADPEVALAEWRIAAECRGAAAKAISAGGNAWELIVSRAHEHDDDLVVLGSHGRTGIVRAPLGSVAERVVRHASCSVLVVRPTQRRPT